MITAAFVLSLAAEVTDSSGKNHFPKGSLPDDGAITIANVCDVSQKFLPPDTCAAIFVVMAARESGFRFIEGDVLAFLALLLPIAYLQTEECLRVHPWWYCASRR